MYIGWRNGQKGQVGDQTRKSGVINRQCESKMVEDPFSSDLQDHMSLDTDSISVTSQTEWAGHMAVGPSYVL